MRALLLFGGEESNPNGIHRRISARYPDAQVTIRDIKNDNGSHDRTNAHNMTRARNQLPRMWARPITAGTS